MTRRHEAGRHAAAPEPRNGLAGRLAAEVRPYGWPVAVIFVVDLLATPLMLLGPVPLMIAVDSVLGGSHCRPTSTRCCPTPSPRRTPGSCWRRR